MTIRARGRASLGTANLATSERLEEAFAAIVSGLFFEFEPNQGGGIAGRRAADQGSLRVSDRINGGDVTPSASVWMMNLASHDL